MEKPNELSPEERAAKIEEIKKNLKKIAFVDTGEALEERARDVAEHRLSESKAELTGFKGRFKKIWKHNLFREYYRQVEITRVKNEIVESKNIYHHEVEKKDAHDEAMKYVVDRFVSEYDETLHHGETKQVLGGKEAKDVENEKANLEIRALIRDFATGKIDEGSLIESKNRIISETPGYEGKKLEVEVRTTDNMVEVARQAKLAVEHGASIDEIEKEIEIVTGKARVGVRTQSNYNTVDKIIAKVQSTWIGKRLFSETGIAIACGTVVGLATKIARSKAVAWGTFGASAILGAGIAGARESVKVEDERRQHAREMAQGKVITENSPRRTEMETSRYETKTAQSLIDSLNTSIENIKTPNDFFNCIQLISDAESRIQLSDTKNIDLISYSDVKSVEKERFDLDVARARAKVTLRKMSEEGTIKLPEGQTFDDYYTGVINTQSLELNKSEGGIEAKDKAFAKMKSRKVWGARGKGLLTGLIVGGVAQETMAFFNDNNEGAIEHLVGAGDDHPTKATALEGIRRWMSGEGDTSLRGVHSVLIDGNHVKIPNGVELLPNPNNPGHYIFSKDGEIISDEIEFKNGTLTQHSEDILKGNNIDINKTSKLISSGATETKHYGAKELVDEHPDQYKKIHRDFWYDNNTKKFDKNELRLHWGGENGTGIDRNGNYVYSVAKMKSAGSFFKNWSVDAQQAFRAGKLKMLLSLSRDTQFNPVEVAIDSNGNAIIDPNSDIAKTFFKVDSKGQLNFIGRFAEVGHSVGPGKDGIDHFRILATDEGPGLKDITKIIEKPPVELIDTTFGVKDNIDVEPPFFLPIFGRQPMEKVKNKPRPIINYFQEYGGSGATNLTQMLEGTKDKWTSKSLKENNSATLKESDEIKDYLSGQEENHKELIKHLAESTDPIDKDCKASICIPVAGHQEGEAIYDSLMSYTNQVADPKSFEIVLFVNNPDKDKEGKKVIRDKTTMEIARFKTDHPEINVRVLDHVIPRERANIGYARKILNDVVLERQRVRGSDVNELVLISNDADNKGVSPKYVSNFIEQFDTNKNVDAYLGQLDWDPGSYIRKPLLHIGIRFFQYLNAQSRYKNYYIDSSGANYAIRAGSFAAIGGYPDNLTGGEDSAIGIKLAIARKGSAEKIATAYAGAHASRLYTSSRRAELALKEGKAPIEMWDKGFSHTDDSVRKVNWDETKADINFDDPESVKAFIAQTEDVINRSISKTSIWGGVADNEGVKKALFWLGIKYKVAGPHKIEITDATKLINGLKEYKEIGAELHKSKTSKEKTKTQKVVGKAKKAVKDTVSKPTAKPAAKTATKPATKPRTATKRSAPQQQQAKQGQ